MENSLQTGLTDDTNRRPLPKLMPKPHGRPMGPQVFAKAYAEAAFRTSISRAMPRIAKAVKTKSKLGKNRDAASTVGK